MEDVQNKTVTLTQEEYDAIIKRLEKMENKRDDNLLERLEKLEQNNVLTSRVEKLEQVNNRPDMTPPVFSGGNSTGLSVPYTPAKKKDSGWETVGKIALGAGLTGIAWAICSAIGGGNSGGGNTFGGDMPM